MKKILFLIGLTCVSAGDLDLKFKSHQPNLHRQTAFYRTHYQHRGETPELYAQREPAEGRTRDFSLYQAEAPNFYSKAEFRARRATRVTRKKTGLPTQYVYPALEEPIYGYRLVPDYVYDYYNRSRPDSTTRISRPKVVYTRRYSEPVDY